MAQLPRPRLVYVGAINDKIDAALLLEVARTYPRIPLVLVGPVRAKRWLMTGERLEAGTLLEWGFLDEA